MIDDRRMRWMGLWKLIVLVTVCTTAAQSAPGADNWEMPEGDPFLFAGQAGLPA
jgi:hypothetical protein